MHKFDKKCLKFRYQLMLKCWSYRPEERPTFRYCLDVLQSLLTQFEDIRINMENASRNFAGKFLRFMTLSIIGMRSRKSVISNKYIIHCHPNSVQHPMLLYMFIFVFKILENCKEREKKNLNILIRI